MTTHAVVWIDHHEAHIFHVHPGTVNDETVVAPHHVHRHPKGPGVPTNHPEDEKHYFDGVVKALWGTAEVLVVGPSTAKLAFLRHVHDHDRAFASTIVGVETVDHPTDAQVVAYARTYFDKVDRLFAVPSSTRAR